MFGTLTKVWPSMWIKEIQNWLLISWLNKQILQVFETSRAAHMSEGNGIRLRITSKYNLATSQRTYQFNLEFKLFILNSNAQPYVATRWCGFIWTSIPYFDKKIYISTYNLLASASNMSPPQGNYLLQLLREASVPTCLLFRFLLFFAPYPPAD